MVTISIIYRCVIALVLYCLKLSQWFRRWTMDLIHRHRYTIRVNIDVTRHQDFWSQQSKTFEQIQFNKPTQVVALIVNETIPDSELSQLIINAIIFFQKMRVQQLIIYDYQGYIKARQQSLLDMVGNYQKKIESSSPLPTIYFQSLLDSTDTWTSVTKTLCERVCEGQLCSDSIDVKTVDQQYIKIVGFSDIQLAVIIGSIKSSLGLHPWLTRLTEFITIDSYKQLSTSDAFFGIVDRYNRIEQRQGR